MMVLKRLTVRNFGALDHFFRDFEDGINIVKSRYASEISQAIRCLVNDELPACPTGWAGSGTVIEGEICVLDKTYRVIAKQDESLRRFRLAACDVSGQEVTAEYLYLTTHCCEQDVCDVFFGDEDTAPFQLRAYLSEDEDRIPRRLARDPERMSESKAFRAYLKAFIRDFRPEPIREGKRYELILASDGHYGVRHRDDGRLPVFLSESEQILFRYLCFLRTAEFWYGFEQLRNLHGVHKPLVVGRFLERLDESIDTRHLLDRTMQLQRQLILLTI